MSPDGVFTYLALSLSNWDFYFLLSALLGLYALHRLGHVREPGEVSREEALRHLVREPRGSIHNFSTVTGLKALTDLPADLVREIRVRPLFFRFRTSSGGPEKSPTCVHIPPPSGTKKGRHPFPT